MLEMTNALSHIAPDLDDRCINNYALLVCLAEKVRMLYCILSKLFYLPSCTYNDGYNDGNPGNT